MSAVFASAMLLQCFFNRPSDGSVPADRIPMIKVPLTSDMAQSLDAKQPPVSSNSFVNEDGPVREWVIGNGNDTKPESIQLLRVTLSEDLFFPSPYSARFGTAIRTDDGYYRFEEKMVGYCKVIPVEVNQ